MNKIFYLFILVFIVNLQNVISLCDENQIDINTASAEELDKLQGIGLVKAQAIIDARPFSSVDDLDRVTGIGNITLNNIKSQGIACVSDENKKANEEKVDKNDNKDEEKVNNVKKSTKESIVEENTIENKDIQEISYEETAPETIKLVPQNIKTEENSSYKNRNIVYLLIGFCFLLALLFFLRGKKYKNEFR